MINFLYSILGFIIAIGVLTSIHEFGHFWVARRMGVKVLRFSIGFGKKLCSWRDSKGTEYVIAALPLGGYVKMLDQNEGKVAEQELKYAFNNKPLWRRALIVLAGPAFNLLFAVFAYWFVFVWGTSTIAPILGDIPVASPAYSAGLRSGQEIVAIDAEATKTWEEIVIKLAAHAGEDTEIQVSVLEPQSAIRSEHTLVLDDWGTGKESNLLQDLGLLSFDPFKPIISETLPDYPAQDAGLQAGDLIVRLDGEPVDNISQLLLMMQDKYERSVKLDIVRDGKDITFNIVPVRKDDGQGNISGFIGVQFAKQILPAQMIRVQRFAPLPALGLALERTYSYSILTLQFLGKMVTGKISLQHISGPISIAQYAGVTVRAGIENFISFLALVSISLGVINLLPIPILDGGHLLFCVIEAVRGRALSTRSMNVGLTCGAVILLSIMLLAIYNDVLRLMH